ncbi:hypothetical protein MNB_SV-5-934 [hydrothermal vent metagenome]|uniref:Uncharacterized protein n=1 Tax=hydrothermal vent metagenome TaxID=652676 RepID=A0A1W1EG75_9ZZZZ
MLKEFLKYILLWILPIVIFANHVHWLGNYDVAHQVALEEQKPLLVLVVKKNKHFSNTVIKNTFMNQKYIDKINSEIIAVIVTYEGLLSYPIEMYYTTVFPTLFLVDSQKELFLHEPIYGKDIIKENVYEMLKTLDK